MCGIFGWDLKGGITYNQRKKLAHALAVQNDDRGGHSWGFYNPDIKYMEKGLGKMSSRWHHLVANDRLIAHTRYATTGNVTVENAHPFKIGGVVGAHNGMVYNHLWACRNFNRDYEVDSQHIFGNLAEGKDLDDLNGYGAIEWVSKKTPHKIYLCKVSASGDLAIYQIGPEGAYGTVWSSDERHLERAVLHAGLDYTVMRVDNYQVYAVRNGELFYVDDKKLQFGFCTWDHYGTNNGFYNHRQRSWKKNKKRDLYEQYNDPYLDVTDLWDDGYGKQRDDFLAMGLNEDCGTMTCDVCPFQFTCMKEVFSDNDK